MRFQATGLVIALSVAALSLPALADNGNGNGNDKLPVYLDRKLSLSAEDTCTPGFIWQGAGNPNSTFQRKRNEEAGIELGIKGIVRQGGRHSLDLCRRGRSRAHRGSGRPATERLTALPGISRSRMT